MKKKKIILIIISLFLMILPFFINVYSIYRLILVCFGITLLDVSFAINKKNNIFLLIYLPIVFLIFTYSIDYIKTYALDLKPIFIFENKINNKVSIYNSLFYRIYKCENEYYFDNNYEKNFTCNPDLIENIDINKLLNEPKNSFKEYKNDFIKVTGKISKIVGTSSIEMQAYNLVEGELNGYVKFNETSKLIINLNGIDVSNYKIYDYITVVGLLNSYDDNINKLTLIDTVLEEKELYNEYTIHIIENDNEEIKEYVNNIYLYGIDNIYLDYNVDKYELSYVIKDKKITLDELIRNSEIIEEDNIKTYKLDKFNVISCNEEKNIIINKNIKLDYSICEE